jgi:hypothetical protein
VCGVRGPVHRHHITGRIGQGLRYLDPSLTVALCPACHAREHVAIRRSGREWLAPGADPLVHRHIRVADFLNRLSDLDRRLVLDAGSTRALAALNLESVEAGSGRVAS